MRRTSRHAARLPWILMRTFVSSLVGRRLHTSCLVTLMRFRREGFGRCGHTDELREGAYQVCKVEFGVVVNRRFRKKVPRVSNRERHEVVLSLSPYEIVVGCGTAFFG